jgi:dTDP-4-amino-4,6-dideoxygalactose transaminase
MSERRIKMIDLEALHRPIRAELDAALARVLDGGRFVGGDAVRAFEAGFANACDSAHAVGCASGSDALLLALMALGIGAGDQVICPAFTFFATGSSIARLGAEPIFVDIDPHTFNLDPARVRERARSCPRLRALLPVDLFGQIAAMDELLALGGELGVPVIEDAAQAIGARDASGAAAGARASVGCFSLYPTKNLGALGDAGILVTGNGELAERLRVLREHGARKPYHHDEIGINSRLDAIQAALLGVKLPHLGRWVEVRRANADHYSRAFEAAGAATTPDEMANAGLSLVVPNGPPEPARHANHQYVVRVPADRREGLRAHLARAGIDSAVYYPTALHQQPCFAPGSGERPCLPETEAATHEVLALPVHTTLTREDVDRVAHSVVEFLSVASPQ